MIRTIILLLTTSLAQAWTPLNQPPLVLLQNGTVAGRYLPEFNQDLFLGLKYANAPRFSNPAPLTTSWCGIFNASDYGNTCFGYGSNLLLNLTQSEDCLNLNIIRPSNIQVTTTEPLPVMVWLYGGGFKQGSASDPMWNMSYIVQQSVRQNQPVIGISVNYRLSFLGFPGGQQALDAGISNLGLKDQRAALQWIQENVGAFGGDPAKVTLWGESAGSVSIAYQLVANGGQDGASLFRSAIMASGFLTGSTITSVNQTQGMFDKTVAIAGCSNATDIMECLRAAPLSSIYPFAGSTSVVFTPIVDGEFIRRSPSYEADDGNIARVPLLLGSNSDEGLFKINGFASPPNTTSDLITLLHTTFPLLSNDSLNAILAAYPIDAPAPPYSLPVSFPWCEAMAVANLTCGTQYRRAAAILGDNFAHASRRNMAQTWVKHGLQAYSYRFDTDPTALPIMDWIGLGPGFALHGSELAYEFGLPGGFTTSLDFYPPIKNVSTHIQLANEMNKRWISFAFSGSPNTVHGNPPVFWPSYDMEPANFVFNATDDAVNIHVEIDDYRAEGIQLLINDIPDADNFGVLP